MIIQQLINQLIICNTRLRFFLKNINFTKVHSDKIPQSHLTSHGVKFCGKVQFPHSFGWFKKFSHQEIKWNYSIFLSDRSFDNKTINLKKDYDSSSCFLCLYLERLFSWRHIALFERRLENTLCYFLSTFSTFKVYVSKMPKQIETNQKM